MESISVSTISTVDRESIANHNNAKPVRTNAFLASLRGDEAGARFLLSNAKKVSLPESLHATR